MKTKKMKLTKEQLKELKKAEKEVKNTQLLKRIMCVKLKDKEWKNIEIAEFLNVRIETLTVWFKAYSRNGIEGLLTWDYEGRQSALNDEQIKQIRRRNTENPFDNASEARDYIKETFGIAYHTNHVAKMLKKNWVCHTKKQN